MPHEPRASSDRLTPVLAALAVGALAAALARASRRRAAPVRTAADPAVTAVTAVTAGEPTSTEPLPGRPRLVGVVGGQLRHGQLDTPPEIDLRPGRSVIGRARDADVRLDDTTVSPRHALLEVEPDGRAWVRDLGALNGLTVDGVPVAEVELHDGNRLTLGDVHVVFRVDPAQDLGGRSGGELGERVAADAPPSEPAENRSDP